MVSIGARAAWHRHLALYRRRAIDSRAPPVSVRCSGATLTCVVPESSKSASHEGLTLAEAGRGGICRAGDRIDSSLTGAIGPRGRKVTNHRGIRQVSHGAVSRHLAWPCLNPRNCLGIHRPSLMKPRCPSSPSAGLLLTLKDSENLWPSCHTQALCIVVCFEWLRIGQDRKDSTCHIVAQMPDDSGS